MLKTIDLTRTCAPFGKVKNGNSAFSRTRKDRTLYLHKSERIAREKEKDITVRPNDRRRADRQRCLGLRPVAVTFGGLLGYVGMVPGGRYPVRAECKLWRRFLYSRRSGRPMKSLASTLCLLGNLH